MLHSRIVLWILLMLFFGSFDLNYVAATWPLSNTSPIQLLGLFPDEPNGSDTQTTASYIHYRAMFKAAVILSQRFNITVDGQFIGWQAIETGGTQIGAISSACQVLTTPNIVGIVGPYFSRETPIIANLGKTIDLPAISYGATDPELSDRNAYPALHRTVPSDNAAGIAISELFLQYNWTSCIIILQNDKFGLGGANAIITAFGKSGLTVSGTLIFDTSTKTFRDNLKDTLLSRPSRIVIVWADTVFTSIIVQYALDSNVVGPQFLWILSSPISLNAFNQSYYSKLVGMLTIEPSVGNEVGASINTTLLNSAYALWLQYEPETFPGPTQVSNYALFAFDAAWSLILSLEKLCSPFVNTSSSCLSLINTTSCYDPHLLNSDAFFNTISTTNFLGVSGPIEFNNQTTDRISGIYYVIQNVQPSASGITYVPVLQWSVSDHWTASIQTGVIIWPGSSLVPPTGLPLMNGVTLRIGVIISAPFTMRTPGSNASANTTTNLVGYSIDLIKLLQSKMGFTPQIIVAPSYETYNQIVQNVADNIYDIVVGDVTITSKRRGFVDFSNSIYDTSLRVITRPGTMIDVDLLSFMRPFSPRLWIVILIVLLYASILFLLMERRKNKDLKERSLLSASAMSLWFTFGSLLGYGADFNVQTGAGRFLTVGLYIVSIILVASYTANLASDLTVTKSNTIISGLADIKSGKVPPNRVGIRVDSSVEEYFLNEISNGTRTFYPIYSEIDMYNLLLNNTIDAGISDTATLEYVTSAIYCNLTLVGADFDPSAYGIVMRKNWLYAESFDVAILSSRETNDLDALRIKWFNGGGCSSSSTSSGSPPYTVETLAGLVLTFVIISILASLVFAWLNRSIIKNYLQELGQRIGWCDNQDAVVESSSIENPIVSSEIHQTEEVLPPASRL